MKIVAIGGGEIGRPGFPIETLEIDRRIVALTRKERPKVLFIPTAMQDDALYGVTFTRLYGELLNCDVQILALWKNEYTYSQLEDLFFNADIIYVGCGDTQKMLAKWRELKIDTLLVKAKDQDKILCGLSAGAVCWFQACVSQNEGEPFLLTGLGFLPGTVCPHYASQEPRRLFAGKYIKDTGQSVLCLDDGAAVFCHDTGCHIWTSIDKAHVTLLGPRGQKRVLKPDQSHPALDELPRLLLT